MERFRAKCNTVYPKRFDRDLIEGHRIVGLIAQTPSSDLYGVEKDGEIAVLKALGPTIIWTMNICSVNRFKREVEIMSRLNHPNVPSVLWKGDIGVIASFIMEYVDGEDLTALIKKGLKWEDAVRIFIEFTKTLEAVHGQGILHRDIKPGNLLIRDGKAVIVDFGISYSGQVEGSRDIIQTNGSGFATMGGICGTIQYTPPEWGLIAANRRITRDIYSSGVMLYEMVSGVLPFNETDLNDIVAAHSRAAIPLLRKNKPDLDAPSSLDIIIAKAMAKKPEDRFQTMKEMRDALESV